MANAVYPKALESLLSAGIDLTSATIKVRLVTNAYTYSSAHQYLSSTAGAVGTDQTLGSKTVTSGLFSAANPTWTAVAAGSTVIAVIPYKDTGSAATSPLLAYIDTKADTTALSIVTDGGNITLQFASGIFQI